MAPPNNPGRGREYPKGTARFRKLQKDNIKGITQPSIRRLARRGGVSRIQRKLYETIRAVLVERLRTILGQIFHILLGSGPDHSRRKTITASDVVFVLKRLGTPIYGWDKIYTVTPAGRIREVQWKY